MSKQFATHVLGLVFIALLGTSLTYADTGALRDKGGFFSESAKSEATRQISEIEQKFKKDLVIETFPEVPDEIIQGIDREDKTAMNRMYEQWAAKEAKQQKVNGIYVLLIKDPAHLQIAVGNDTQNKAFTLLDRDNLASLMLNKLRKKENDEALKDGVNFVFKTMASHASPSKVNHNRSASSVATPSSGAPTMQSNNWSWIVIAIVGFGVLWLIMGVVRALFSGGAGSGLAPNMGGGGGIFGSLLGGMFGAAAGMWLYDQFSGSHANNAWGDEPDNNNNSTGFFGQDTDYSSTGGDFDNDFGGDDNGGGGDF